MSMRKKHYLVIDLMSLFYDDIMIMMEEMVLVDGGSARGVNEDNDVVDDAGVTMM